MADTHHPDEATVTAAQLDEANSMIEQLRLRCVTLNVEVRKRDDRIRELEGAMVETEVHAAEKVEAKGAT